MAKASLTIIPGGRATERLWLQELYSKYGSAVLARCRYLLKDSAAAEDAMQDVFAKAMLHEAGFRREASPLTWLTKISTHHCLNVIRAQGAAWKTHYVNLVQAQGDGHGGPSSMEARDLVRKSLADFDVETQAAVVHYFVDEMTLEEVAALLERSVPTIRKRLRAFSRATGESVRADVSEEQ
jgi:RNA polymerase sigma-70 factor (ECF subfamily)